MIKSKKGFIHTLESSIAAIIFLLFIINLLSIGSLEDEPNTIKKTGYNILNNLEQNEKLNRSEIRKKLEIFAPNNYKYNQNKLTVGRKSDSFQAVKNKTINFKIDLKRKEACYLNLFLTEGEKPRIKLNGELIWNSSRSFDRLGKNWEITSSLKDNNELDLKLENSSRVKYSIDCISLSNQSQDLSNKDEVFITSFLDSGERKFEAKIYQVISWQ